MANHARELTRRELIRTGCAIGFGGLLAPAAGWALLGRAGTAEFPGSVPRCRREGLSPFLMSRRDTDHGKHAVRHLQRIAGEARGEHRLQLGFEARHLFG